MYECVWMIDRKPFCRRRIEISACMAGYERLNEHATLTRFLTDISKRGLLFQKSWDLFECCFASLRSAAVFFLERWGILMAALLSKPSRRSWRIVTFNVPSLSWAFFSPPSFSDYCTVWSYSEFPGMSASGKIVKCLKSILLILMHKTFKLKVCVLAF